MIFTGLLIGLMTLIVFIILVEKLPGNVRYFVFGHHLLSDVLATGIVLTFLPVTGTITLLSAMTFCLLFTVYLFVRRKSHGWKRINIVKTGVTIERG